MSIEGSHPTQQERGSATLLKDCTEMSFDTMLRALVSKGYFPSELPPVFNTIDFGTHVSELLEELKLQVLVKSKWPERRRELKFRRGVHILMS